jgi:uncharacterized protein (DUF4415 family)
MSEKKPGKSKGKTNFETLRARRKSAPAPTEKERKEAREFWADADVAIPDGKTRMTVRFDTDVVEWFKSHGPKYQTRMNAVLRQFMNNQRESVNESGAFQYEELDSASGTGGQIVAEYMEALNQLGKIRMNQGKQDAASSYFEEAVDSFRRYAGMHEAVSGEEE